MRVRAFVDFWNFQISINDTFGKTFLVDWSKLGPWFTQQAAGLLAVPSSQARYEGLHVYLSYGQGAKDPGLKLWATNVLDRFPGVVVTLKERKPKNPPNCPSCRKPVPKCPTCGASMAGTVEKGIDTAMVTDVVSMAWKGAYDVAVLVSSDADFIPAVEFLDTKGLKTINAHFSPAGMELARRCWASLDLKTTPPPKR